MNSFFKFVGVVALLGGAFFIGREVSPHCKVKKKGK